VQDRRGQAFALNSIGRVLSDQGKLDQALPQKLAAISLAKAAGDPDLEGRHRSINDARFPHPASP
jgi:hypothetical protein